MSANPFIRYCIDSPKQNETITFPFILISGWIISTKENIIEKPALYSGEKFCQFLSTANRPDVEAVYPNHFVLAFQEYVSIVNGFESNNWLIEFLVNGKSYTIPLNLSVSKESINNFLKSKTKKLQKIKNFFICPQCGNETLDIFDNIKCRECDSEFSSSKNNYNFLTKSFIDYGNIKPTSNVSANQYDPVAINIIKKLSDGLTFFRNSSHR